MAFKGFGGKDDEKVSSGTASVVAQAISPATSASGAKSDAFLGRGSKVVGTLTFSGPVDLDGHVEGEIIAQDKLNIGESAVIHAKITGAEITIRGTVHGDIVANKRLSLKKPAKVVGNIASANLSIEEGVIFEGKCVMSGSPSSGAELRSVSTKPGGPEKAA